MLIKSGPMKEISSTVDSIMRKYWLGYPAYLIDSRIRKTVFDIQLLQRSLGELKGKTLIDVGGGWGLYAASCAALGMKVILLDDYGDPGKVIDNNDPRWKLPNDFGFTIIKKDIILDGLGFPPETFDAITSFEVLEHLHASPKEFLHEAMDALRSGGVLLLGTPNCVNIRKRLSILFGKGHWTPFSEWYEPKIFRGHVREPNTNDLRRIAKDISLSNFKIFGQNWMGFESPSKLVRISTKVMNKILNHFPSLCSNIYLLGFKH